MCKDKALTHLASFGYSVVRLPNTRLAPLALLGRASRGPTADHLGSIAHLATSQVDAPPTSDSINTTIIHRRTDSLSGKAGLSLLDGLLSSLGASAGASGLYSGASKLAFAFDAPVARTIDATLLGNWLRTASMDFDNPATAHYMEVTEDSHYPQLLVVTEVLMARSIHVFAYDQSSKNVRVSAHDAKKALGGRIAIGRSATQEDGLTYEGPELLAFGFKAYRLERRIGGKLALQNVPGPTVQCGEKEDTAGDAFQAANEDLLEVSYVH